MPDAADTPITRPILVTGSHRGGTTWVGDSLAQARGVHLFWEPFSTSYKPCLMHPPAPCWFYQVTPETAPIYQAALEPLLDMRYDIAPRLKHLRHPREVVHMLRDKWVITRERARTHRVLFKDPIALFSAPWIEATFNADVIVTVRRPMAFCDSLLRAQLTFPFKTLLTQTQLIETRFANLRPEIERLARKTYPIVDQAILLYRLLYQFVKDELEAGRDSWHIVLHETFAADPVHHFRQLYSTLGLEWSERIARFLEADSGVDTTKWARNLTPEQIRQIRSRTEDLETYFYGSLAEIPGGT